MFPGSIIAARIVKIKVENKETKSFYLKPLEKIRIPQPGQFFMIWIPRYEEIPISASGVFGELIRISVAKRGKTTSYMHQMTTGDLLGLKGPLGNSINLQAGKKYILIGGGYGVAPLIYTARKIIQLKSHATLLIGARTKDHLLFIDEARSLRIPVFFSTDDGSAGYHGTVIELAKEIIHRESFDEIISCGPKEMLIEVARLADKLDINSQILAESYMKCGIGVCGSCELGQSGLLVCKDGPVFSGSTFISALGL